MRLRLVPLTQEAFAPYGQVLMARGGMPERIEWAALVENMRPEARANITYMSLEPELYPIRITELERHPFSHQMFVPLSGTNHLVLVCPSHQDGSPNISASIAFHAAGGQTVNYNANIWHAPRTVLNEQGAFIMLRWDSKTADDTESLTLQSPLIIEPI
jgi:ureidoglycolate lyase